MPLTQPKGEDKKGVTKHCFVDRLEVIMNLDNYLLNHTIDESSLKKYGFTNKNGEWILEYDLPIKNLFVLVKITKSSFSVRVIDREFNDDFLPFSVKDGNSPVKAMVDDLVSDIVKKCFTNLKLDVIRYCEETYKTKCEKPWDKYPEFCTFKTLNSKKWYAIIMNVPARKLGLDQDGVVDIINIKLPTDQIQELIDNQKYFNAYHMNKKNWITILLNKNTDVSALKNLLQISYDLVEKNSK